MEELPFGTSLWGKKFILWLCTLLVSIAAAKDETPHSLAVSATSTYYACPTGATVKMVCNIGGHLLHTNDSMRQRWFFTSHFNEDCMPRPPHLHTKFNRIHNLQPHYGFDKHSIWIILHNVTHGDEGRYCCALYDIQIEQKHPHVVQRPHSHFILQVTERKDISQNCTFQDSTPPGGSVAVALAITACILALLSLPLILVLVYKQRHSSQSGRRGQELVRMDSEAQGYENPTFLVGSQQNKTRTVSQIMTRQPSETGRHLLSEPGTPLSPPAHGDVFFPVEDTIPESPDIL
ncbi:hypothetical protein Q5P01_021221 [Channa striata]|uniref:Ig-like domain-containing protein n=1 Tax=Channa striata TaxID=64152 RepID=A0AA88RYE9_CHASR|nr:hypothetical protein Q5P01_021221 [Channa striata]